MVEHRSWVTTRGSPYGSTPNIDNAECAKLSACILWKNRTAPIGMTAIKTIYITVSVLLRYRARSMLSLAAHIKHVTINGNISTSIPSCLFHEKRECLQMRLLFIFLEFYHIERALHMHLYVDGYGRGCEDIRPVALDFRPFVWMLQPQLCANL